MMHTKFINSNSNYNPKSKSQFNNKNLLGNAAILDMKSDFFISMADWIDCVDLIDQEKHL